MKRHNDFEQRAMSVIKLRGNVQLIHERLSVKATEVMKQSNNQNKLFTDVASTYCTETGNQKRTEFVYNSPLSNLDIRIECKSRKKLGLLGEILLELNYVANIPEKLYCLVLSDELIDQSLLKLIETNIKEKNLTNKVWFGSLGQFDIFLMNNVKR